MQSVDHSLVNLRLHACYLWFNVLQIILTLSLLLVLTFSLIQLISLTQIWITFFIALDLILRYFSQGHQTFFTVIHNQIDIGILVFAILSIWVEIQFHQTLHNDGEIVTAIVLSIRVLIQIIRLVNLILVSKKTIDISNNTEISIPITLQDSQQLHYKDQDSKQMLFV